MYVHIGNNAVVRDSDIIGVFDIETSMDDDTREYLAAAGRRRNAVYVSWKETKSFIVSVEKGKEKVYITNVGHKTIANRINNL